MEVIKKEWQKKEVQVTVENYTLCDKCNKQIAVPYYDAFEFNLEHKTGDSYPEGGAGEKDTVDLCQECAKDLIKLLKDNGYRVNSEEWDY